MITTVKTFPQRSRRRCVPNRKKANMLPVFLMDISPHRKTNTRWLLTNLQHRLSVRFSMRLLQASPQVRLPEISMQEVFRHRTNIREFDAKIKENPNGHILGSHTWFAISNTRVLWPTIQGRVVSSVIRTKGVFLWASGLFIPTLTKQSSLVRNGSRQMKCSVTQRK